MNKKEKQFNKLINDNGEKIQRICNYYSSNSEDQKDMYQEILTNIWKSLDSFKGNSAISTWIYRIAVNTSLGFTGKAFKRMKLLVNANTDNLSYLVDESFDDKIKEEEQFNKLQIELNQLSVIDKSLISLMLEGVSMKEIASIIGITESNVKVKIHRIKDQLKSKLSEKSHE